MFWVGFLVPTPLLLLPLMAHLVSCIEIISGNGIMPSKEIRASFLGVDPPLVRHSCWDLHQSNWILIELLFNNPLKGEAEDRNRKGDGKGMNCQKAFKGHSTLASSLSSSSSSSEKDNLFHLHLNVEGPSASSSLNCTAINRRLMFMPSSWRSRIICLARAPGILRINPEIPRHFDLESGVKVGTS